jgi:hypothetical protein
VFIRLLNEFPSKRKVVGQDPVSMIDNCRVHVVKDILELLFQTEMGIIIVAPHKMHVLQFFDREPFGVFQKPLTRAKHTRPFTAPYP